MKRNWFIKNRIDDEEFVKISNSSKSMSEAASKLGLHFNSFKKRALELDCYQPNQSGIGIRKNSPKIPIEEIVVEGKHPRYQSYKLKQRLLSEGFKINKCDECGIDSWNGKTLNIELHHIDGNRFNHLLENLAMLCPNCHSQTDTFRAKNKKN